MTVSLFSPVKVRRTINNPVTNYQATFIQTSRESYGRFSELEFVLHPGGGNEMHYHKTYAEKFTAIKGTLGIRTKTRTITLHEGESFTVVPGEHHCFFNPTPTEVEFRVRVSPGHEGFENALRILYGLAADGLTNKKGIPKKLSHIALIATMSDTNLPGFFTFIFPLLEIIAKRARRSGIEKHLLEKYC